VISTRHHARGRKKSPARSKTVPAHRRRSRVGVDA
jgi:hypothetical protein